MNSRLSKMTLPIFIGLGFFFAVYLVIFRPGYLLSTQYLGMLILLESLVVVLWKFEQRFFPVLVLVFLAATTTLPFESVRWVLLGVGALAGCAIFLKDRRYSLGIFHYVALFCVLAALASATVPGYSSQALLKTLSLLLLFLYGSFGARLAVAGRERQFIAGLLLGCEMMIYLLAVAYFIFRVEILGNPNSLGAVMGVVGLPLMLWGFIVSDHVLVRRRRGLAFLLALCLLLSSYSRAGIAAAAVSCVLLCLVLRRYNLLIKGCVVAVFGAVLIATIVPPQAESVQSVTSAFLYKGHENAGFMDSRTSVWEQTLATIREHPWSGTGFGTLTASLDAEESAGQFASNSVTTREHGDSYLAVMEGVGLLGAVPFLMLVLLVVVNAGKIFLRTRKTRDPIPLALPIAAIMVAGLVNAGFEDWLFAVGYYLCIFFWSLAFVLVDLTPGESSPAYSMTLSGSLPRMDNLGMAPSAR
jgi:O-antigen ligase